MDLDGSFQIDEQFLFETPKTTTSGDVGPAAPKRPYDPTLFKRGLVVQKELRAQLQRTVDTFVALNPDKLHGLNINFDVRARAKSQHGAYKVRLALIDLILGPRGMLLTQEECRSEVQVKFPDFSVPKDWTKPLSSWETAHARKQVNQAGTGSSSVAVKAGMSLRDLHAARKLSSALESCQARTYRTEITFTDSGIVIGGLQVKQTVNRSNGKEYVVVRLNTFKLEEKLAAKHRK